MYISGQMSCYSAIMWSFYILSFVQWSLDIYGYHLVVFFITEASQAFERTPTSSFSESDFEELSLTRSLGPKSVPLTNGYDRGESMSIFVLRKFLWCWTDITRTGLQRYPVLQISVLTGTDLTSVF